jgi:hypothetical protein
MRGAGDPDHERRTKRPYAAGNSAVAGRAAASTAIRQGIAELQMCALDAAVELNLCAFARRRGGHIAETAASILKLRAPVSFRGKYFRRVRKELIRNSPRGRKRVRHNSGTLNGPQPDMRTAEEIR